MKVAILVLLCIASVFATEYATEEGVLVLTDNTWGSAVEEFDFILGEFYAPWCGHCKKLAPEYAAAAQQLAESNPNVKLAKVDCTVEKDTCGKFDVKGFPTLKFFTKGGEPIAYEGGRTAPEIVNWLKKKTGPASVQVTSVEQAEKLASDSDVAVLFFGAPDSEAQTAFLAAANAFEDVAFGHTDSQAVREKYEVQGEGLVLLKKFDEGRNTHTGGLSVSEIKDFINTNKDPTIVPFDQKAAQKIFGEGVDSIFLITGDNEAGSKAEEVFRSIANELKGKITLSIAKIEDSLGGRLAEYIGVTRDHLPAVRIVQPGNNNQKFVYENEVSGENLLTFVKDFIAGKLKPYFKSEAIPEEPFEDNVRVVVGKNFEDVVLDPNSDVLVEFYAPWCGHCKTLAPILSAVGAQVRDVQGLVVAKMDSTANEVEGVSIQGFPTIKFYPKGNKQNPVDYNGERTEEGFINFFRENSAADLSSVAKKVQDIEL